jgi:hypothetical protein
VSTQIRAIIAPPQRGVPRTDIHWVGHEEEAIKARRWRRGALLGLALTVALVAAGCGGGGGGTPPLKGLIKSGT